MMNFRFCCILSTVLLLAAPYAAYSGDSTVSTETGEDSQFTDAQSGASFETGSTSYQDTADTQEKSDTAAGKQQLTPEKSAASAKADQRVEKAAPPAPTAIPPAADAKTADTKESADNSEKNAAEADSKTEPESGEEAKPDHSLGSISQTGLIVAEENRWYYEEFDQYGRPISAVLCEKETELETIRWKYVGTSHHPAEKTITTTGKSEQHIRYDAAGNITLIEQYDSQKKLIEKTENTYNPQNNLIEQIVFDGQHHDKTVWEYTKNKAVSQTKYRNDEKTVFIELLDDKRIVHVFVDGKEVFVTEEP